MNGWEYADDARERWERVEMDTDRQVGALAERDAEILRLRGLLDVARGGLQTVLDFGAGPVRLGQAVRDALHRSDPSVQPESGE